MSLVSSPPLSRAPRPALPSLMLNRPAQLPSATCTTASAPCAAGTSRATTSGTSSTPTSCATASCALIRLWDVFLRVSCADVPYSASLHYTAVSRMVRCASSPPTCPRPVDPPSSAKLAPLAAPLQRSRADSDRALPRSHRPFCPHCRPLVPRLVPPRLHGWHRRARLRRAQHGRRRVPLGTG